LSFIIVSVSYLFPICFCCCSLPCRPNHCYGE